MDEYHENDGAEHKKGGGEKQQQHHGEELILNRPQIVRHHDDHGDAENRRQVVRSQQSAQVKPTADPGLLLQGSRDGQGRNQKQGEDDRLGNSPARPEEVHARCVGVDEGHHQQQFGNQRAARGTYQQAQPSAFQESEPQSESHEDKEVPEGANPYQGEIKPGEGDRVFWREELTELQFEEEDS